MPDFLGDDMRKPKKDDTEKEEKEIKCEYCENFTDYVPQTMHFLIPVFDVFSFG